MALPPGRARPNTKVNTGVATSLAVTPTRMRPRSRVVRPSSSRRSAKASSCSRPGRGGGGGGGGGWARQGRATSRLRRAARASIVPRGSGPTGRRSRPSASRAASSSMVRFLELVLADLVVEGDAVHVEHARGTADVPPARVEHRQDVGLLRFRQRSRSWIRRGAGDPQREVGGLHEWPLAHDHRPLDRVLELAHVARPGVTREGLEGGGGEAHGPAVHGPSEALEEVRGEKGGVLRPLPQRRDVDVDDVEPPVEILPEVARLDGAGEVPVGGGDGAEVDRHRGVAPPTDDDLVLQHPEQLDLDLGTQLPDLVEEDRSSLRRLELTLVATPGTREGPRLVTEELALEDPLRQRAAVDDDHRVVASRGTGMDGAGHELLARPRLSGDEHRGVGGGDGGHELEDVLHRRRVAEERRGGGDALQALLEEDVF